MYFVGTDIGGTFTDIVSIDDNGELHVEKVPSTPGSLGDGVVAALAAAGTGWGLEQTAFAEQIAHFAHGTTAATNAFIERRGAPTALLTTRGFGDILRLQRATASWVGTPLDELSHYAARSIPQPIIERRLIAEVTERIDLLGKVVVPLDVEQARQTIRSLRNAGIESFAVSLLWSFRNPEHERRLAELIAEEAPGCFVSISSELVPVLGEYERTSTTAINAYLGPVIRAYVRQLEETVHALGCRRPLAIMDSSGGVMTAEDAASKAAGLLTSGPAGGVLASASLARQLGLANVITTDMGGTSFDVGVIIDSEPVIEPTRIVGRFDVALPAVKVVAIGAGGGSIARVSAGRLTIGPDSAGANPGPAGYGRGGELPTVTDADLVLGIIDPEYFLGGQMPLDRSLSERAIADHVARPLGMSVTEAAAGIREVADNQMADVLRSSTMRVGLDPRDFVLFAFGGAGPTHAYRYAAAAGISTIVVPTTATAHSAFGCVTADERRTFTLAVALHLPTGRARVSDHLDVGAFNAGYAQLEERAATALGEQATVRRWVGMRFRLQVHEIAVPVPQGLLGPEEIEGVITTYVERYERIFGEGTALLDSGVEFTTLRLDASVPVGTPRAFTSRAAISGPRPKTSRPVTFYELGETTDVSVVDGPSLAESAVFDGPLIVEYPGTTAVVGPGQRAVVDRFGDLIIGADDAAIAGVLQ